MPIPVSYTHLDVYKRQVHFGEIQFIAVGTPPDEDGSADLQYVVAAARNIGRHMTSFKLVVDKSTVPVGTAGRVKAAIQEELRIRDLNLESVSYTHLDVYKRQAYCL